MPTPEELTDWSEQKKQTKLNEGFRSSPYKDTVGKTTIGYGFNISDPTMAEQLKYFGYEGGKISNETANKAFENAFTNARFDAAKYLGYDTWNNLDKQRQGVLIDMSYNLGLERLSKFKKMRDALIDGDYKRAAREMENSKWATQVGDRATRNINMMRGR